MAVENGKQAPRPQCSPPRHEPLRPCPAWNRRFRTSRLLNHGARASAPGRLGERTMVDRSSSWPPRRFAR